VPIVLLLFPIAGILAICRLFHGIAACLGQPPVIGEVAARLLLGPSFLGWIAPALFARLFPEVSLPALNLLSQIGLALFMFPVGLHLDLTEVIMALVTTAITTPALKVVLPEEYRRTA
jgi:Kef-type K+ transport system membrane component KefB